MVNCMGFPGGSVVKKNLPAKIGDAGWIPRLGISPEEGHGDPLWYSCLENPVDRYPEGCSPWGRKKSDTPERLNNKQNLLLVRGRMPHQRFSEMHHKGF